MRSSRRSLAIATLVTLLVAGCDSAGATAPGSDETSGDGKDCLVTLAEVRQAVPDVVSGPWAGEAFKFVTQSCSFVLPGVLVMGAPQLVVQVWDLEALAAPDGIARSGESLTWEEVCRDLIPGGVSIAGVGDGACADGEPRASRIFAVRGPVGIDINFGDHDPVAVEGLAVLVQAAFARL